MNLEISKLLRENSYPGRGIVLGRSSDGRHAVIAYFIMGRSENSRNPGCFPPTARESARRRMIPRS